MGIAEFVAAAVVTEGIVSYVTTIVKNKKIEWKIILAIVLGCVISFNLNKDKLLDNSNLVCLCTKHHKEADKGLLSKTYLEELARKREQG